MSDQTINIIDQHVTVELRTNEPRPPAPAPWSYPDLLAGRITWGRARNARYQDVRPSEGTD